MPTASGSLIRPFIERWKASGASERANYALFLAELCDVLGVDRPEPASSLTAQNDYVFERPVTFYEGDATSTGFIDLYKRDAFVLEAKQGSDAPSATEAERLGGDKADRRQGTARRGTRGWERAMERAKNQAYRYARALPPDHGWPPFLLVVDVGHCIDVYADFTRQGKHYDRFPDPAGYRILLDDLADESIRERLRLIFTDPQALDPARRSARVTRTLAERLARLAASLEQEGHAPDAVAHFLMRCLFTMFAEDVGLLPARSFTGLMERFREAGKTDLFHRVLAALWQKMDTGGFSPVLEADILQFNGGLFHDSEALPLSAAQLDLLIEAARADWKDVEPAIFGTLLERALDPVERHKLGAHFTPRSYVERLVLPAVIEPLREEWTAAQAAAVLREAEGDVDAARAEIVQFHRRLCAVRVLDPACGSGNFLYVTLEHLKRLEAEVLDALDGYGGQQRLDMTGGYTVSPDQFRGLEVNPRAAAIAEVVLWIGYLQWHFRTYGDARRLDPPLLKDDRLITLQDAVLHFTDRQPRLRDDGTPVTRWDGRTTKPHPATGEEVPDEAAQVPVYDYTNPEPADWPEADFIVGNPPFIGASRMRDALGDGYAEALRSAYNRRVPKSADYVMYWWYKAAELVRKGAADRFGFITTNSITQTFNRKVVDKAMTAGPPLSIAYAVPDHPWVLEGADVRIAMTVGAAGSEEGRLQRVTHEEPADEIGHNVELKERRGNILPDLTIGADVAGAEALEANADLSNRGFELGGAGFIVTPEKAQDLGLGRNDGLENHIRPYLNGRDLMQSSRNVMVIDLYGLGAHEVRERYPEVYQHVYERVKPERDQNRSKLLRERWWLHRRLREDLRDALKGLSRFIATVETAKHRVFVFLDQTIVPDNKLVVIALEDAFHLGVLSSRIHVTWALAAGGRLGVGNDPVYSKSTCFDPFPFPEATDAQQKEIRALGEQLDAHRKARQAQHPDLTLTDLYNVLDKLRAGEPLDEAERRIHDRGLVAILKELHDELDAAVAAAYGWPADLDAETILERLVALNARRRAEEQQGLVRYLRPAYQNPDGARQQALAIDVAVDGQAGVLEKQPWPGTPAERARALRRILTQSAEPLTAEAAARHFHRAQRKQVASLLETFAALGIARKTDAARYAV